MREWIVPDDDIGCDGEYFDYQEVIRCKDCKHNIVLDEKQEVYVCYLFSLKHQDDNNFCSWAERRTDESD